MGGVIPTEDEARRINAAVRAYEASATSRLTSRGNVPKKRVRIEPTVASPGSTTTTIGNCPCTSGPGVITPTVTSKFSHRQAYRWKRTGLMSMLNDIDGFNVTSEPVAVWNTDTPTNSYISADITRTVGADSDVYVLTVTEDSTHGWKLNFSIKSGASPNITDQIDWTEVCVSPNAPSPSKSNAVIVLDTETKTSEDGAYIDHPGCAGCLVPSGVETVTITDGECTWTVPRFLGVIVPELVATTPSNYVQVTIGGTNYRVTVQRFVDAVNSILPREIVCEYSATYNEWLPVPWDGDTGGGYTWGTVDMDAYTLPSGPDTSIEMKVPIGTGVFSYLRIAANCESRSVSVNAALGLYKTYPVVTSGENIRANWDYSSGIPTRMSDDISITTAVEGVWDDSDWRTATGTYSGWRIAEATGTGWAVSAAAEVTLRGV